MESDLRLEQRLRLEQMVSAVSLAFLRESDLAKALDDSCRILGETMEVSRVYLFENFNNNTRCCNTVEWTAEGIPPVADQLQDIPYESLPYWQITLEKGEVIRATDIHTLPPEVVAILEWQGIESILVVPLFVFERWYGFLGFDVCGRKRLWRSEDVALLETVARIFAAAFEKRELSQQVSHSARLSAVGALAAGVAHEYNNLHAGILGLVELALEDPTLSRQTAEDLRRVRELIHRGADLTRRLLGISRQEGSFVPVELGRVVADALALLDKAARTYGATVQFDPWPVPLWVKGSAGELSQVLLNLLLNALEAMTEGTAPMVRVALFAEGDHRAVLEVEDNGPGLPPGMEELLFEPFFTTKGKLGGGRGESTGLGLTISSRIVGQHQGKLTAHNRPTGGARFRLELPLASVAPAPADTQESPSGLPLSKGRVIVLDDEPHILEMLGRYLVSQGHYVETFSDDLKAAAALRGRSFDVALVDLVLPANRGLAFLDLLNALPAAAQPELVVMSGKDLGSSLRYLGGRPSPTFVAKPFPRLQVIGELVQRLLARRQRPPAGDGPAPGSAR